MDSRAPEPLRVLIANERKERLKTTTGLVAAMGHHVIARSLEVSEVAAATAEAMPDVALVGVGESSEHALDLISQIVQEAACPVIAILETKDAEFVNEAAKRGIFAYVTDGDPEELQGRGRHRPAPLRRVPPPRRRARPTRAYRAGQGDPEWSAMGSTSGRLRAAPLPLPAHGPQADRPRRGRLHQPPPARQSARTGLRELAALRRPRRGRSESPARGLTGTRPSRCSAGG